MRLVAKVIRIIRKVALIFFVSTLLVVTVYRFVPIPGTPLMAIRCVQQLIKGEELRLHYRWVPGNRISDALRLAVIASEDQRFFSHWGFDLVEIKRAVEENKQRERPRGASTISQQTAKNIFLWPRASWLRKGLETYFTLLIELIWGKERILDVYLNCIETGNGIYGAQAVARRHMGTTAQKLTPSQSALIAATLPNPIRFNSQKPTAYLRQRQQQILKQMSYMSLPEK